MEYEELGVDESVRHVIDKDLPDNTGGMIALDRSGRIATHCNTPGMVRAWIATDGQIGVNLGKQRSRYARISRITFPAVPVSRSSRPLCR
jgi:hypothetical protein